MIKKTTFNITVSFDCIYDSLIMNDLYYNEMNYSIQENNSKLLIDLNWITNQYNFECPLIPSETFFDLNTTLDLDP